MELIDSHAHLQDDAFREDREAVFRRAREAGIGLIVPGYSQESSSAAVAFAEAHEETWALVGVHPHEASGFGPEDEARLREWSRRPKVVGIGEIGLDYHYNFSPRAEQRAAFRRQLEIARELDMPVSIHSREAEEDTIRLIREVGVQKGVLHCFTGSLALAEAALAQGLLISVAGILTFANAHALREVVRQIPLAALMVETDSPYLAPVPHRGRRNEPLFVREVAHRLALEINRSNEEVFSTTMANALRTFLPNA